MLFIRLHIAAYWTHLSGSARAECWLLTADYWLMSRAVFFRRRRLHFSKTLNWSEQKVTRKCMSTDPRFLLLLIITIFSTAIWKTGELTGKWLNNPALKEGTETHLLWKSFWKYNGNGSIMYLLHSIPLRENHICFTCDHKFFLHRWGIYDSCEIHVQVCSITLCPEIARDHHAIKIWKKSFLTFKNHTWKKWCVEKKSHDNINKLYKKWQ